MQFPLFSLHLRCFCFIYVYWLPQFWPWCIYASCFTRRLLYNPCPSIVYRSCARRINQFNTELLIALQCFHLWSHGFHMYHSSNNQRQHNSAWCDWLLCLVQLARSLARLNLSQINSLKRHLAPGRQLTCLTYMSKAPTSSSLDNTWPYLIGPLTLHHPILQQPPLFYISSSTLTRIYLSYITRLYDRPYLTLKYITSPYCTLPHIIWSSGNRPVARISLVLGHPFFAGAQSFCWGQLPL